VTDEALNGKMIAMAEAASPKESPEELGARLVATCRWCDDMRRLALAGLRAQHPHASERELDAMLYAFRLRWEQVSQCLRRIQTTLRK
jgi:hypothetical protein